MTRGRVIQPAIMAFINDVELLAKEFFMTAESNFLRNAPNKISGGKTAYGNDRKAV